MVCLERNRGFTLVELMIVVAIVAVLAVLAVVGVRRYLSNAKSSEARFALGLIGKGAAQALEREATSTVVIAPTESAIVSRRLCLSATERVPSAMASVSGRRFQPDNTNGVGFHKDDFAVHTGFACVRFEMVSPQAYQYDYVSDSTDTTQGTSIAAIAIGNINGDAVYSTFRLVGAVQAQALTLAPSLEETNPDE